MPQYRLSFGSDVGQAINNAPGNYRQRIRRTIVGLLNDPYPANALRMRDDDGRELPLYRVQIDAWRIVYTVDDEMLIVEILRIGRKSGPDRGPTFYEKLST